MPLEQADLEARVQAILAAFEGVEAPLIEILHAVQRDFGHVPEGALRRIAEALNLSRAEVHGVVSFYHDFRTEAGGRHDLKICRAEACQAMGGEALARRAREALGIDFGETAADGSVSLGSVYCLGLCACAPAAMLDGTPVGRLDGPRLEALISEARR